MGVQDKLQVGTPSCPEEYKEFIEQSLEDLVREMDDDTWTFHSQKEGIKAETKTSDGVTAARGKGYLNASARCLWDILREPELRTKYDVQLEKTELKVHFDEQTSVNHYIYKAVWPTTARDFCLLGHWRVTPNGEILFLGKSIEHPECPEVKKNVRAEALMGGWRLRQDTEAPYGTHVDFIIKTDLKGKLPSAVVSKVTSVKPYTILELNKMAQKLDKKVREDRTPVTNTIM